jgi:hypothetical protein
MFAELLEDLWQKVDGANCIKVSLTKSAVINKLTSGTLQESGPA